MDSSDSSLSQRIGQLDLNEALFCRGIGSHGLYHKEISRTGAYPAQVKLPCPLGLLSQWEEMAVVELLVDQEEWQVHGPHVTMSVFDLTVYAASVGISAHPRKFTPVPQYEMINSLPKLLESLMRDMVQWIINISHISDLSNQNLRYSTRMGLLWKTCPDIASNLLCFVSHSTEGNVKTTRCVNRDIIHRIPCA
jgi:hypothetical protein